MLRASAFVVMLTHHEYKAHAPFTLGRIASVSLATAYARRIVLSTTFLIDGRGRDGIVSGVDREKRQTRQLLGHAQWALGRKQLGSG